MRMRIGDRSVQGEMVSASARSGISGSDRVGSAGVSLGHARTESHSLVFGLRDSIRISNGCGYCTPMLVRSLRGRITDMPDTTAQSRWAQQATFLTIIPHALGTITYIFRSTNSRRYRHIEGPVTRAYSNLWTAEEDSIPFLILYPVSDSVLFRTTTSIPGSKGLDTRPRLCSLSEAGGGSELCKDGRGDREAP
ncbi:hypothetical protein KQX54_016073 [Cotesia glomerata]|uniref:Uncharacterized protein n=1 Tax=Cotesia glomerata TaxID=32391 RepID=A0AAV7HW59_COTGL|nr:hypothetical protein KQX54_016073 [Cotesia glomerata]